MPGDPAGPGQQALASSPLVAAPVRAAASGPHAGLRVAACWPQRQPIRTGQAPDLSGVVLSSQPLTHYSPLSRSSGGIRMLAFDKDEIEALGLIKIDLLGLRMLAALERAREETLRLTGEWVEYGDLPDDPAVWARIVSGDTMGLFQIESPAQVQMMARLQPRNLTELAHWIALARPDPVGDSPVIWQSPGTQARADKQCPHQVGSKVMGSHPSSPNS